MLTRLLQSVRFLGLCKPFVLWDNRAMLARAEAIVTVEDTVFALRRMGLRHSRLIYSPHGAGDGRTGFAARVRAFDYVLLAGPRTAARMLAEGMVRPGRYEVVGSVKMQTVARLHRTTSADVGARPMVLHNPHKDPALTSWPRFIEPMLRDFAAQDALTLVVAPHVKMFHRRSMRVRRRWERRGSVSVRIDTGSDRSMDGTYAAAASLYVGDVSSQVYEFLAVPRPCVFLNAHGIDWRGNVSFAHWHLGDVVDDPAALMAAILAAPARHGLYRDRQQEAAAAALGDPFGSAERAAPAILGFIARSDAGGDVGLGSEAAAPG